jgi:hypothetical protein
MATGNEFCSLMWRAALQECAAEVASEVAQEAERTGERDTAVVAWMVAHRNRVHALKLRAQADADRRRVTVRTRTGARRSPIRSPGP